jgi:hypothetical protein
MSAREQIFGSIRRSLGVTGNEAPRRKEAADRMMQASDIAMDRIKWAKTRY